MGEESKLYLYTHYEIGNTFLQLAVAALLCEYMSLEFDQSPPPKEIQMIDELLWYNTIYPQLEEFKGSNNGGPYVMTNYFQNSEQFVAHRHWLLETMRNKYSDLVVNKRGILMKGLFEYPAPIELKDDDIVVHIRLGDFKEAKYVLDPANTIAVVRSMRRATPDARVIIVAAPPKTAEEDHYLRLFEEFSPLYQHGTELGDFALLRDAKRIVCSNSTYAWVAAYIGSATERWIPESTYNKLGKIDPTDHLYVAPAAYDITRLAMPSVEQPPEYLCTEFFMQLCDYVVVSDTKIEELHKWLLIGAPLEKRLNIDDSKPWPEKSIQEATSIFIHPEPGHISRVAQHTWPNLRLVILGNSDNTTLHAAFQEFLERHPNVYVWETNNLEEHPRVRTLPIGFENSMWRYVRDNYEPLQFWREAEREYSITMTFCSPTNHVRYDWANGARNKLRDYTPFIYFMGFLRHQDFIELIRRSGAVVCPPGNGADTHRHWEALAAGCWMILQKNQHTSALRKEYPSLPIIEIEDIEEIRDISLPLSSPAPFHPLLLTEYWRVLHRSHIVAPVSKPNTS